MDAGWPPLLERPTKAAISSDSKPEASLPLPPLLPDVTWRFATRVPRDHHLRIGTCDYSVPPRAIGRRVEVRVDLDQVTITLGREVIVDQTNIQSVPTPTHPYITP